MSLCCLCAFTGYPKWYLPIVVALRYTLRIAYKFLLSCNDVFEPFSFHTARSNSLIRQQDLFRKHFIYIYIMHVSTLSAFMSASPACLVPMEARGGLATIGSWGPLPEQLMLLNAEPALAAIAFLY